MDFSALLKALTDETEGTHFSLDPAAMVNGTPPPSSGTAPMNFPPMDVAAQVPPDVAPVVTPTHTAFTPPPSDVAPSVSAPMPAPTPDPVAIEAPTKPTFQSAADHYGIDLKDVVPTPLRSNWSTELAADLGRAGNTISSAIAHTKNDDSFYDNMEKRGLQENAALDQRNDQFNKFKQALLLKFNQDKQKAGDWDPDLANPMHPKYKARMAFINSTPQGAKMLNEYIAQVKASGQPGQPVDLNNFNKLGPQNLLSAQTSTDNSRAGITAAGERQKEGQQYDSQKRAEEFGRSLGKQDYAANIDVWKEQRHSNVVQRAVQEGATPTETDGKLVKAMDANTSTIVGLVNDLKGMIANSEGIDLQNPLKNRSVAVLHQKLLNAARVAEQFGVPSGKDMEQLAREIADPTTFGSLIRGQATDALDTYVKTAIDSAENLAKNAGYKPYGSGGSSAPRAPNPVRDRILGEGGAKAPPGATPPPQTGKTVSFKLNGKKVTVPADKESDFTARFPNAERI